MARSLLHNGHDRARSAVFASFEERQARVATSTPC
jgi:hypothetical protein